jgi:Uma2 family endonuclease
LQFLPPPGVRDLALSACLRPFARFPARVDGSRAGRLFAHLSIADARPGADDAIVVPMTGDRMRPTAARKLTYDDFVRFPDDGLRHELIDGEHHVTPSPATVHQCLVGELHLALGNFLKARALGRVFVAPFDVVLSNHDIVEPDLLVVLGDQADIVTRLHVRGAPAIVIEVLSPGTRRRDEALKRDLYARAGVREYWMVDPDAETVRVCRWSEPGASAEETKLTAAAGDTLETPLLPGFALGLGDLFAARP